MDWRKALPQNENNPPEENHPSGYTFYISPMNLTGGGELDSPTMMAPWLLKQIYLSGCVLTDFAAEPEGDPVASMTAQLLIGGDIVWQQTDESPMTLLVAETHFWGANFNFGEDFVNPVEFAVGRTLQLAGSYTFRAGAVETTNGLGLLGGYFPDLSLGKASQVATPAGTLTYASQMLSGHRTL